jgi:Uma2 family endonuclease
VTDNLRPQKVEAMTEQRILLTAEEFFEQYSHKEGSYELVKGEVVEMAPPGWDHGEIAANIAGELRAFVRQHDLGRVVIETGFWFENQPDIVRIPDVTFLKRDRAPVGSLPGFFMGAPDLAVEVVSPWDTASQLEVKVHDYLRTGAQRVWVVYPDSHSVVVHRPDGQARRYGQNEAIEDEELLPGFSLPLREIFRL